MKQQTPSAPIYPDLAAERDTTFDSQTAAPRLPDAHQFRLQQIGELETFLRSEIECRGKLHKKYRRAVNFLDGLCAVLSTTCVATGAVGAGMLASGIGFTHGLVLEAITVARRCAAKAAKHDAVRVLAMSKQNTVHSHISKGLGDCQISDDEYKLILDEVEKYRSLKENLCRKHAPAAGSMVDEETKKEMIRRGREQARASFIKKLATSESPSP